MVAVQRRPVPVVLVAVGLDETDLQARQGGKPRRHVLVPIDLERAARQVRAEHRNAVAVSHLRDAQCHAQRLRHRLERDGGIAERNPLLDVMVAVCALVRRDPDAKAADVALEVLRERLISVARREEGREIRVREKNG